MDMADQNSGGADIAAVTDAVAAAGTKTDNTAARMPQDANEPTEPSAKKQRT